MLYPKIGIRPVIDGRWGGVRESLEAQTMAMADNAAKLISENLKYPDGTPVQCVVGCTTIGGGAEAAEWPAGRAGRQLCGGAGWCHEGCRCAGGCRAEYSR